MNRHLTRSLQHIKESLHSIIGVPTGVFFVNLFECVRRFLIRKYTCIYYYANGSFSLSQYVIIIETKIILNHTN